MPTQYAYIKYDLAWENDMQMQFNIVSDWQNSLENLNKKNTWFDIVTLSIDEVSDNGAKMEIQ